MKKYLFIPILACVQMLAGQETPNTQNAVQAFFARRDAAIENGSGLQKETAYAFDLANEAQIRSLYLAFPEGNIARLYILRFATEAETRTIAFGKSDFIGAVRLAHNRLQSDTLWGDYLESIFAKGCLSSAYQKFFKAKLKTLSASQAKLKIAEEIRAVLTMESSEKRDAWLAELRTFQILYKEIQ